MPLHHIAIAARNPERLADFYEQVLELRRLHSAEIAAGSVWLSLENPPGENQSLLMIEQADVSPEDDAPADGHAQPNSTNRADRERRADFSRKAAGYHLIALDIAARERGRWLKKLRAAGVAIEGESPYTIYLRDPEGNRIGLSHFPLRVA